MFVDLNTAASSWDMKAGDWAVIATLIITYLSYALTVRSDRRKREQEAAAQEQFRMQDAIEQQRRHTENTERLNALISFRSAQEMINSARDEQIKMLSTMAATATEALKGFNRRLELVENAADRRRRSA